MTAAANITKLQRQIIELCRKYCPDILPEPKRLCEIRQRGLEELKRLAHEQKSTRETRDAESRYIDEMEAIASDPAQYEGLGQAFLDAVKHMLPVAIRLRDPALEIDNINYKPAEFANWERDKIIGSIIAQNPELTVLAAAKAAQKEIQARIRNGALDEKAMNPTKRKSEPGNMETGFSKRKNILRNLLETRSIQDETRTSPPFIHNFLREKHLFDSYYKAARALVVIQTPDELTI